MKKLIVFFAISMVVFAGKRINVYSGKGNYGLSVSNVDSITFINVFIDTNILYGMRLIPAKDSSFTMGLSNGSLTQNVSFTKDFYMDTTEVTQKHYDDLMSETYSNYKTPKWTSAYGLGDNYPAYYVNWYDAVLFCNARSIAEGKETIYDYQNIDGTPGNDCVLTGLAIDYTKSGFRLPTEAEWEYACRAKTTTDYHWNKDYDPYPVNKADSVEVDSYAVWRGNSSTTCHVLTKEPNAFILYNMCGNVWEWCSDQFGDYSTTPVVDPTGAESGTNRIKRGGSWNNSTLNLRSGDRLGYSPNRTNVNLGFRVTYHR